MTDMKAPLIQNIGSHPDPADGDEMIPAVKAKMKKVGMGAHGMMPHTRLDQRKSGGWIHKAVPESHKGMLHKALDVPQGEKIPEAKLEKAANSGSSHVRHMAQFAKNVKGLGKG